MKGVRKPVQLKENANVGRPVMTDDDMCKEENPQQEGQITSELNAQSRVVELLVQSAGMLEESLADVLRGPCPDECAGIAEKEGALVPVAAVIRSNTRRIEIALVMLRDIRERLEL